MSKKENEIENNDSSDKFRSVTFQIGSVVLNIGSSNPSDNFDILESKMKSLIDDAEGLLSKFKDFRGFLNERYENQYR